MPVGPEFHTRTVRRQKPRRFSLWSPWRDLPPVSRLRDFRRELWWALPRLGRAGQGEALGVLSIWIWWDRILQWIWRLRPVRPDGVLRYRTAHHWGRRITLNDGTAISRGDPVLELHFDNSGLMRMTGIGDWNPWDTIERIDADLDHLGELVLTGRIGRVIALHGVTLFASPGRRLGFEVRQVPHTWNWSLERYFLIGLLPIFHHDGWRKFDRMRRDRWPAELWMSIDALLARKGLTAPR